MRSGKFPLGDDPVLTQEPKSEYPLSWRQNRARSTISHIILMSFLRPNNFCNLKLLFFLKAFKKFKPVDQNEKSDLNSKEASFHCWG